MRKNKSLRVLVLALLAVSTIQGFAQAQVERPRLVVGIMVDQMRWDYLYTLAGRWHGGGFDRLLGQGFSCQNTIIDYVPTVTACGHASVYTGTTPAFHGIAGNDYMIDGQPVSSVKDTTVVGVGTTGKAGRRSPRNLLVTTMGDQIKLATDGQARVVGLSLKDRASILPAGHAADGAYWYDNDTHTFVTSTYYRKSLPDWVTAFNRTNAAMLAGDVWRQPVGVTATFALAEAALRAENLGADAVTDLLAMSISTTDAAAHTYGVRSQRVDSIYEQLDRELARFLDVLDQQVGKGRYLLFLTADHGGTYSEAHMRQMGITSGRFFSGPARDEANRELQQRFGASELIKAAMGYSFYINNEAIAQAGLDREAVKAAAVEALGRPRNVMWAVDCERAAQASVPAFIRERIMLGWNSKRSGEIFVLPVTGHYSSWDGDLTGSNHGTWNQSDSHIPLLFYGWHVPAGETARLTHMTDIAPTVCAMLHIQAPDAAIGQPISFIVQ